MWWKLGVGRRVTTTKTVRVPCFNYCFYLLVNTVNPVLPVVASFRWTRTHFVGVKPTTMLIIYIFFPASCFVCVWSFKSGRVGGLRAGECWLCVQTVCACPALPFPALRPLPTSGDPHHRTVLPHLFCYSRLVSYFVLYYCFLTRVVTLSRLDALNKSWWGSHLFSLWFIRTEHSRRPNFEDYFIPHILRHSIVIIIWNHHFFIIIIIVIFYQRFAGEITASTLIE